MKYGIAVTALLAVNLFAAEPPPISVTSSPNAWFQVGNPTDAYLVEDSRWGQGSITEGPGANQFNQAVGVSPVVGPAGEVAFRMQWRWPDPPGSSEVKGYPSVVHGRKPGYYSSDNLVNGHPVILPDKTVSQVAPSGHTPGTSFPLQLPVKSLKSKFTSKNNTVPTGEGHLVYDIWLTSEPQQTTGFWKSSITHEIMIPVQQWGGYGSVGNRNPGWYDHDAWIGGVLYHVYVTKQSDGQFLYNFGSLSGEYGRTGWKMIAFVPDRLPVTSAEIDLAAIVNYIATRSDNYGNKWATGKEWVASVEFGVEPKVGSGDITVYDYKVWSTLTEPVLEPTTPVVENPPVVVQPPTSTCEASEWQKGKTYPVGSIVNYENATYVALRVSVRKPPTNGGFWARYYC